MKIARMITGLLLALAVAGCGGGPPRDGEAATAAAQPTFKWKLVTTWPKNLPALGTAPERLAEEIRKASAGRLDIKVHAAGELAPAFEVFDVVSQGTAEMGHGASYYWRGKVPAAVMFAAVPFGMTADETNAWLHYGGGLELWRELYAPFNLIPFACGNSGTQMAGWFNREITSVQDLEGLKKRIPGIGGEVFQRAGGTAVNLPGSEIYTSLQTGTIDATEWVGPYNDLALGLHETAKYYYYPGWQEPGSSLELIINKDAWNALPEDLQAIVTNVARAINQDMADEFTARNKDALRDLVTKHDVQLRRLPDDVLARLKDMSAVALAEVAATDELAGRIHASYTTFAAEVKDYHAIAEQAYLEAR